MNAAVVKSVCIQLPLPRARPASGVGFKIKARSGFKTFDMDGQTVLWKEQADYGPPSSAVMFLWVKMLLAF